MSYIQQLKLDVEDCDECGRCEHHITGLVERLEDKPLFINTRNPNVNMSVISKAIRACPIGAIGLFDLDGNELSGA